MSDHENPEKTERSELARDVEKELSLVRGLAAILKESGVHEIDYEVGECRIRVAKSYPAARSVVIADEGQDQTAFVQSKVSEKVASIESASAHHYWVKSPMVGTVYLAQSPDAAPFVSIGSQVQVGQTILIIEAMKTMNYVKAEKAGCVREILVKNGAHIEFGQSLVCIE